MNAPVRLAAIVATAILIATPSPAQDRPTGGAIAKLVPPVPTPASFISDERGVLTAGSRASIDSTIRAIQVAGLGDIAVAILPSIGEFAPSQVALEIYRTWRVGSRAEIGSARRNLGVLILIVPKEIAPNNRGECWINTGLGAEGIITDATAASICRDAIIPRLRERDHAGGISAGIKALEGRLRGDPELSAEPAGANGEVGESTWTLRWAYGTAAGLLTLFLGLTLKKLLRYRRRKCRKCGRKMRRLSERAENVELDGGQRMEERLNTVDYDVWVCECEEVLIVPYMRIFHEYVTCRGCKRLTARAKRRFVDRPTLRKGGLAEDAFRCRACGTTWEKRVVLAKLTIATMDSASAGGSSGGDSFGGSGSSSGGGGGSSY